MKKIMQSVLLFVMILCPAVAWSGDISKGSLDKLMALSGLNKQMSDLPNIVIGGAEESRKQYSSDLPDAVYNDLKKAIEKSFRPSEILQEISMEIKKNLSEAEARSLLNWYESDIGRKITKAEEDASTPAAQEEMMRNASFLIGDHERVALAEKMESVLHVTDMTIKVSENSAIATLTALSTVAEPGQRENTSALKIRLSQQIQESRAHVREMVIVSNVYGYKDIDIAGIEKYIKFIESAAARKFNNAAMKGMEKSLKQSTEKMAKAFAAEFKKYIEKNKEQP
jgi:hypothetical protein